MKTKYFAIAAAALALVACDKNNDDFNIDNTKDTPITIASAGVAELSTRAITNNKLVGTSESDPATMSVFITGGSADKYNAANVKWTHDGTEWRGESTVFYEGSKSEQQIYACSPYDAEATSGSVTVTATDQTDWLVTTESESLTSNIVNLTMKHALAKLMLDATFGTEVGNVSITSVKVGGMYASGTLNISDNTWNLGDNPATTELTMTNNLDLLIIPMASCTSFPIVVTISDSRVFKSTVSLSGVGDKLDAGTLYIIKLQVGQDKVTLGEITASPWTQVTGGELETE